MNKITDLDYYLPHVFAVSPLGEAINGTTAPVIIRGIDERIHDESAEYYLKPIAAPRMSVKASMFELLAAFIAKQIDLSVAEPVLVNIDQGFIELCRGKAYFNRIKQSPGINFGTKNFGGGFITWLPETSLPYNLESEALKIFIFDMLIQNADRGHQKANLNTNGKELKIFDQELAFSYINLISTTANEPWVLNENGPDKNLIFKHLFHKHLKGKKDLPIDDVAELLKLLNENFWLSAEKLIPDQWMNSDFLRIKKHSMEIIGNLNLFKIEIRRVLS